MKLAAADDTTLGWAQKLISAVQLSAAETGWSPQALAADPNVQVHHTPAMSAHAAPPATIAWPLSVHAHGPWPAQTVLHPFDSSVN